MKTFLLLLGLGLPVAVAQGPGEAASRQAVDQAGHPVLYNATEHPIELTGPEAQQLILQSVERIWNPSRHLVGIWTRFQPNGLILGFTPPPWPRVQWVFRYAPGVGYAGEVYPPFQEPNEILNTEKLPQEINLNKKSSFDVYQYGSLYAAGTVTDRGLIGATGYDLLWENEQDAINFVRALWALNAHPKDLDPSLSQF